MPEQNPKILEDIAHATESGVIAQTQTKKAVEALETPLEGILVKGEESNQLLKKIAENTVPVKEEKSDAPIKIELPGISVITLKGDKGDDSKPEDVAKIIKEDSTFVESIKGKDSNPEEVAAALKSDSAFTEKIKGEPGRTPVKGVDFNDGEDGEDANDEAIKQEILSEVLQKIPKSEEIAAFVEPGKDGSPDTPLEIKTKLQSLPEGQRFRYDFIDGAPDVNQIVQMVKKSSRDYLTSELKDVNMSGIVPGQALRWNGTTFVPFTPSAGVSPGGSNTQVQFNDSGSFGGDSDFTWNKTTNTLKISSTNITASADGRLESRGIVNPNLWTFYGQAFDGVGVGVLTAGINFYIYGQNKIRLINYDDPRSIDAGLTVDSTNFVGIYQDTPETYLHIYNDFGVTGEYILLENPITPARSHIFDNSWGINLTTNVKANSDFDNGSYSQWGLQLANSGDIDQFTIAHAQVGESWATQKKDFFTIKADGRATFTLSSGGQVDIQNDPSGYPRLYFSGSGGVAGVIEKTTGTDDLYFGESADTGGFIFRSTATTRSSFSGILGIGGVSSPTAKLHIAAGSTTASSAPLKFNSGSLMTAAEAGAMEFLTDGLFFTRTTGAVRENVALVQTGRLSAQTAAQASVVTYTPTVDSTYRISANVLVTTATTHNFTVTCAYTDEGNTARTSTLSFMLVAGGTLVTAVANANGAVPYMGVPQTIRVKANTAITIATTGTFTTVTYNVEGNITKIN